MRHRQPVLGSGWGPMPTPPSRAWPKIRRQFIIGGILTLAALFTGILASPRGGLAVLLAWPLTNLFLGAESRVRKVVEWGAVAAVAAIVAGAFATGPKVTAPPLQAPAQVDAAQADQLEGIREGVVNLYEQLATGFSQATKEGGG